MDRVATWSEEQVCRWLEEDLQLPMSQAFRDANVNGMKLLQLDEKALSALLGVDEKLLYLRLSAHISSLKQAFTNTRSESRSPSPPTLNRQSSLADSLRTPKSPTKGHSNASTASGSCTVSSTHRSSLSSPRGRAASPRSQLMGSMRARSPVVAGPGSPTKREAWSSFANSVTSAAPFFDTAPRLPSPRARSPGPAQESLSPSKRQSRWSKPEQSFTKEDRLRMTWQTERGASSPGPSKYTVKDTVSSPSKASPGNRFSMSPRRGCTTTCGPKKTTPKRPEDPMPGPWSYTPQYQHLSTFK